VSLARSAQRARTSLRSGCIRSWPIDPATTRSGKARTAFLGAPARRLFWPLARAWRARLASKCRRRPLRSRAAYLALQASRRLLLEQIDIISFRWLEACRLPGHSLILLLTLSPTLTASSRNQAGRVRPPQHDQLPSPSSEPHCSRPTADQQRRDRTLFWAATMWQRLAS
jgi:hypothetical protein